MKRVLVLADLHCGHLVGLTPPGFQDEKKPEESISIARNNKLIAIQKACWSLYEKALKDFGPYDAIFVNGDAIDGKGTRSGGTEQITTDLEKQADMAVLSIRKAMTHRNTPVVMTYGTPYHASPDGEDWENIVASDLNAKIGSHEWVDVEGVMFDLKHQVSGSTMPHGRFTAIARESMWASLWAEQDLIPKSNVIIRSHVHYHVYCGDDRQLRIITPALQGFGTKYGSRRCSGIVNWGFIVFECHNKTFTWKPIIYAPKEFRASATKL